MELNKIFQAKVLKWAILIIVGLVILLFVFKAGMFVGFTKARFSFNWDKNYHLNFGGPGGFMPEFDERNFMAPHGTFGAIVKIDGSTIVIKGDDGLEKIILISDQTDIREFRDRLAAADLKVDAKIVVIGEPDEQGQINAKFIRILPPEPAGEPSRQFQFRIFK